MMQVGEEVAKYQLLKYLGSGAHGRVFLVNNLALSARRAVKFIECNKKPPARLLEEARNLSKCAHKHTVVVYDADVVEYKSKIYVSIEMEYLPKGAVSALASEKGLSIADAIRATIHMLFGLSHAHGKGVIHRDVKPGNIMISGGDYKLSDFGLAFNKTTLVTANYMYMPHAPPEFFVGDTPTEAGDIYSAAVTLYRLMMLQGNLEISEDQLTEWVEQQPMYGLPEHIGIPGYVPRRVVTCIKKGSAFKPSNRYQSADEMLKVLEGMRVAIPWKRINSDLWSGEAERLHTARVVPVKDGFATEYLTSNRRVTSECKNYDTYEAAQNRLNSLIRTTALA